ncbi:hypothetical protein DMN91_010302 [Ooceraea biroi]|uniref:Xaa-Pro aminopeptidase n=1 Tax=Ooceraea biroi TaxID=2015173 RepID=A0A3L8DC16_OOCBI|nr:hypothetical protein DMN91_010302 [Ooceraea biroi]
MCRGNQGSRAGAIGHMLAMKKLVLRILLTSCVLELTKANVIKLSEPVRNYNGAKRSYCPVNAYIENQPINRHDSSLRLRQLRSEMVRVAAVQGPALDGYIVTSDDEHQSESVDPRDMRKEFLTGFYGSAGKALVTIDKAILWTDGRYHVQADQQLDCNWILMKQGEYDVPRITEWLIHEFQNRSEVRIGANPKLISAFTWEAWEDALANSSIRLVAVRNDLVDLIWQVGRPEYNPHAAYPLADEYSGKPWQEKIRNVRLEMELSSADALVVTALDDIAWLFNIRGYDLPYTPVLRAYAIITHGSLHLYAPRHKILRSVDIHLKTDSCFHANCVKWHNYTAIWYDLKTMSQAWNTIPAEKILAKPSPVINLRAEKNKVEIEGMRRSHIRDAVAMCDFLAYMEEQYELDSEGWDEMQVARVADEFRYEQDHNRDGTTDVTRTLHFGTPTEEQRKAYTRVLIGSIELSSLIFPSDLTMDQLDIVARRPLWSIGYDYTHGTGHGIGHFSSVHESPIHVAYGNKHPLAGCSIKLQPGFFLSNEPGYYKEGDFGVRLENILEVLPADKSRRWLSNYNRRIREEVGAELKRRLKMKAFYWMMMKTATIPETSSSSQDFFPDYYSRSTPSATRQFHVLVVIVAAYHVVASFTEMHN